MARKVFISVLGTGYYNRTKYYYKDLNNYVETRFIQEATLKLLPVDWEDDHKALFFLTEAARKTNWVSPAQKDDWRVNNGERDTYKGLEERITAFPYESIDIPNGNNEQEIWDIFKKVFDTLEDNDKVYFDITHAFRSIPMLVMVLINYAKFLKNIEVKGITYGNWEGRDKNNNLAPIIDLTTFSTLQDWTSAANDFVSFGNSQKISTLLNNEEFSNLILKFTNNFATSRAIDIYTAETSTKLSKFLKEIEIENQIESFKPLYEKIRKKTEEFKEGNLINNGLIAVKYCIDHSLIQQGITLLAELIITYVLVYLNEEWNNANNRSTVSGCLNINKEEKFDYSYLDNLVEKGKITFKEKEEKLLIQKEMVNRIFSLSFKKELSDKLYKKLSQGSRNDINHAGIRPSPKDADYLIERLRTYYEKTVEIISANKPINE